MNGGSNTSEGKDVWEGSGGGTEARVLR
jgi:hypothetical protein